jgi:hypothetical protein
MEEEMLRASFTAVAIWLATGLTAASAASCEDYCLKTRCAPGDVSYSQATCMSKCMQGCNMKHKK